MSELRASTRDRPLAALAPLLVVAIFAGGYAMLIGWPRWPVTDAGERIAYSALVAGAFAAITATVVTRGLRVGLHVLTAVVCVAPTVWPEYQNGGWGAGTLVMWVTAIASLIIGGARLTHGLGARHGVLGWFVLLGMVGSGGVLLMATGSLKLGEAGFALAAGVLIAFVIGLFVPAVRRSGGVPLATIAILGTLLTSGHLWSELPLGFGLCVMIAPTLAWVVRVPIVARRTLWQRVAIGLIVAAIPATVVTTVAVIKAQRASQASESGY